MIELLIFIAVLCLAAYVVTTFIPMPDPVQKVIWGVVILVILLYVLRAVGADVPVPRWR